MSGDMEGYLASAARAIGKPERDLLKPGWLCTITRRDNRDGGVHVLCGEVRAVDSFGVRITLMDWVIGSPSGWDCIVPWTEIELVGEICTESHSGHEWGRSAADRQGIVTRARSRMLDGDDAPEDLNGLAGAHHFRRLEDMDVRECVYELVEITGGGYRPAGEHSHGLFWSLEAAKKATASGENELHSFVTDEETDWTFTDEGDVWARSPDPEPPGGVSESDTLRCGERWLIITHKPEGSE